MTVTQLIDRLRELPADARVFAPFDEDTATEVQEAGEWDEDQVLLRVFVPKDK